MAFCEFAWLFPARFHPNFGLQAANPVSMRGAIAPVHPRGYPGASVSLAILKRL